MQPVGPDSDEALQAALNAFRKYDFLVLNNAPNKWQLLKSK